MNLDYLKTYLEVVRLGSFSAVARKFSLSQPAVSQQIQALERDLGMRLIDRRQKTIALTEAGRRLLVFAELVESERQRLGQDLDQLREEISGDIAIAASNIPGEYLLAPLLAEFRKLHPAIGTAMLITDSLTAISLVQKGNYEVGFCGTLPEGTGLTAFEIASDEIVLVVPPDHHFARRKKLSIAELEGQPLIIREPSSGTQRSLESLLGKAGFDPGKFTAGLVLGSTQSIISAVESGAGIAFVSSMAIKKSQALGLVKVLDIEGLKLKRSFYCIYRRERIVSRLLQEFIAFIASRTPLT